MVMTVQRLSQEQYDQAHTCLKNPWQIKGLVSVSIQFCRFLANRDFCLERVPEGFLLACELALSDLRLGIDSGTAIPIRSDLVGLSPFLGNLIRHQFLTIAEAIFPEEFAAQVRQAVAELRAQASKEGQ